MRKGKSKTPFVAVVHDRKKKEEAGKPQSLEIRVTCSRRVKYFGTGIKVYACEWKNGRVANRVDASVLNERLAIMLRKVERYINDRIEDGKEIDFAGFQLLPDGQRRRTREEMSFLEFAEKRAAERVVRASTRKHYFSALHIIREYGKIVSFRDLTPENIIRLGEWLAKRPGHGYEHMVEGSAYNIHKFLKMMCGEAVLMGRMQRNPYSLLPRGYIKRGDRENVEYLTEDEVRMIERMPLTDLYIARARDLFLFQIYTGMAYADMCAFSVDDCERRQGLLVYGGDRTKTGRRFFIVIQPKAVAILERYGGQLPVISNQKYNSYIKILGGQAGIRKRMHSHLARHTFATMMLARGMDITNVSRMLGHTNVKQTQRYAKVLEESVMADAQRIFADMTREASL